MLPSPTIALGQALMEVALENEIRIIRKEPWEVHPYLLDALATLYLSPDKVQQLEAIGIDTAIVIPLLKGKTLSQAPWTPEELPDVVLVSRGKKIKLEEVEHLLAIGSEEEQKSVLRDIDSYNGNRQEWRKLPLKISRPVFNEASTLAIIGYKYGNSGGKTVLFYKIDNRWKVAIILEGWIY